MCNRPITKDGKTFSCRSCDACIAARRANWIARAMAEKALAPHTLCVALTYSDETQTNRDAAAMFAYADISAFLKRLRTAANKIHKGARIRFLCAGEQGDRFGRCHWHLILYSDCDLTGLGVFTKGKRILTTRQEKMTKGANKNRVNWSIWGKGFCTLQEPDQGAMAYVLSYCLKDQFTREKSAGTMRETKSENFATGLFRMSKRPAIGSDWIMQKLSRLDQTGECLTTLNIKIPDMTGFWYPSGTMREKILWGLVALHQRAVWNHGRPPPQWSSLLSTLSENPSDMVILDVLQKTPEQVETIDAQISRLQRERAGELATRETAARCGGQLPCTQCLLALSEGVLGKLGVVRTTDEVGLPTFQAASGFDAIDARQATRGGGLNAFCQNPRGESQRRAFPATSGRANPDNLQE